MFKYLERYTYIYSSPLVLTVFAVGTLFIATHNKPQTQIAYSQYRFCQAHIASRYALGCPAHLQESHPPYVQRKLVTVFYRIYIIHRRKPPPVSCKQKAVISQMVIRVGHRYVEYDPSPKLDEIFGGMRRLT